MLRARLLCQHPPLSLLRTRAADLPLPSRGARQTRPATTMPPPAFPSTASHGPELEAIGEDETFAFASIQLPSWEVFAKTRLTYCCVNLKPVVPGHILALPRRRVYRFSELTPEEVLDLFTVTQRVGDVVQRVYGATSLTLAIQDGPEAGQTVKHVHVHVIPRKGNDFPQNDDVYRELDRHDKEPDRPARGQAEMTAEAAMLRTHFYPSKGGSSS